MTKTGVPNKNDKELINAKYEYKKNFLNSLKGLEVALANEMATIEEEIRDTEQDQLESLEDKKWFHTKNREYYEKMMRLVQVREDKRRVAHELSIWKERMDNQYV